ncbi:MAG: hypothetical protein KGR26_04865 [Cyanobacteria bacterium REEB65]|nr:hypothetical protein [Cyanobacteria bacterium REEB65]
MPTITRLFIKTALVYLLCALALETAWAWRGGAWDSVAIVQVHLLAVGWLTQMVFGVGYWLFPMKLSGVAVAIAKAGADGGRGQRSSSRGPQSPLAIAYILLNAGLIGRAIGEPLIMGGKLAHAGWILAASAAAQLAAAALFVWQIWPRIRERA